MDDDERVSALRAIAHPVRLRILSLLTGAEMSAAEVARELDLTHANASYHLRQLLDADEIVVAGEERIRGGVAKRYRYPHERHGRPARQAAGRASRARATADDRVLYARALGLELERRTRLRAAGPHVDFDLEGWVPPEVWAQACLLLQEAARLLHDANAAPRAPGTIPVSATGTAFRMTRRARA